MISTERRAPPQAPSASSHGALAALLGYFAAVLLFALLFSQLTGQFRWGEDLEEFIRTVRLGDPHSFATAALDVARYGWITPENQWLIRTWPPGFMVLEGLVLRLVGEDGPFLVPLLAVSAFLCAAWMTLLRAYLLRSDATPRRATLLPLLPFVFPLVPFWLLSPMGLAFGESFSISLFLIGYLLALLALRRRSLGLAGLAGVALGASAYFRSQFELVVLFLTLGGVALAAYSGVVFAWKRRAGVGRDVLLLVLVALVGAHLTMAPWRYHNKKTSDKATWVFTSRLVAENALKPEQQLRDNQGAFIVNGGGHLACKLEPAYCGQTEPRYFYSAFFRHMGAWLAYKGELLPRYWMAPARTQGLVSVSPRLIEQTTPLEKAANLGLLACMLLGAWRLWAIRRDPVFPVQAWLMLSLYACLAGVYTMVHLEARYLYLPKIFGVVALASLLAPRRGASMDHPAAERPSHP